MRRRCNCLNAIVLAAAMALPIAAPAEAPEADTVRVPLVVGMPYLEHQVARMLELDADGRGRLEADACNHLELSAPEVAAESGRLVVDLAAEAVTGARFLGRCRGPGPWRGRIGMVLEPRVTGGGTAVEFHPVGFVLSRPDGSRGIAEQAVTVLAESLILPRLERGRIDLAPALDSLESLLAQWLEQSAPVPVRLEAVAVESAGMEMGLGLAVPAGPATPARGPEAPLAGEELERWNRLEDELDGFLTVVVMGMVPGLETRGERLELLAVLLDARHRIAAALADDAPGPDPVRALFLDTWRALRPWLARIAAQSGGDDALELAAFTAAGDALQALDALGPAYGVEVSRDGLRRLARLLLGEDAPATFTPLPLAPDPELRELLGLGAVPAERPAPAPGWFDWLDWFIAPAAANAASPAQALRGMVPRLATLDEYLDLVAGVLQTQARRHLESSDRVPKRLRDAFDPLVRATAWKESCWRQYVGSSEAPRVLESPMGAVGMMQINARVWRGVYELERLADDVEYNIAAGAEILEHYLVDYAIRRGEHEHEGGDDNLIRATYAGYNGGPGQMSRYRRADTPAHLRAIDRAFWDHYQTVRANPWPEVSTCYAVSG